MKHLLLLITIATIVLGCSTEAEIKIINRTDNNIYFQIEGDRYTIDGFSNSETITIDTGSNDPFSERYTSVELKIDGDTFLLPPYTQNDSIYFPESTVLELQQDETRKIYCDPTHAGVKVNNNFDQNISRVRYFANNLPTGFTAFENLGVGQFDYKQLKYYELGDTIYYSFQLEFDDGTIKQYGGDGNLLEKGELFFIDAETVPNE